MVSDSRKQQHSFRFLVQTEHSATEAESLEPLTTGSDQNLWTGPRAARFLYSCRTQSVPGYGGRFSWYFFSKLGGTNRPPRKWYRPVNMEADFLGAVREMSVSGWRPSAPPRSTSQPSNNQNLHLSTNTKTRSTELQHQQVVVTEVRGQVC